MCKYLKLIDKSELMLIDKNPLFEGKIDESIFNFKDGKFYAKDKYGRHVFIHTETKEFKKPFSSEISINKRVTILRYDENSNLTEYFVNTKENDKIVLNNFEEAENLIVLHGSLFAFLSKQ